MRRPIIGYEVGYVELERSMRMFHVLPRSYASDKAPIMVAQEPI